MGAMSRAEELQALRELRELVETEKLNDPTPAPALAILALHLTTLCAGLAAFLLLDQVAIRLLGLAVSFYGGLGVALSGHNASHCSLTCSRGIDRVLTYLCFPVVHGVSATYWYQKHVRAHHLAPNTPGIDTDIELLPFFAMSEDEVAAATGWQRKLFSIQHWLFPIFIALIVPNLQAYGLRYLAGELRAPGRRRRIAAWVDAACIAGHLAAFIVVPAFFWPLWQVLACYALREIVNGYLLFSIAAPAHFPLEARFVHPRDDGPSLIAGQICTTVNFRAGFLLWLITQGAEHQIEHHVLPAANPLRLARVRALVEPFCARHGLPYQIMGWGEAVIKSVTAMRHPRPVRIVDDLVQDLSRAK